MTDYSKRIAALSPEQRALLAQRLANKQQQAQATIPIRPRTGEPFPLSYAQERLWFTNELAGNTALYSLPNAIQMATTTDVAVLERSLNEIIRRHEILRTVFITVDGQPFQVIQPFQTQHLPVFTIGGSTAEAREDEVARFLDTEAHEPFDLYHGPLMRFALLRLPDSHILVMNVHHLIVDDWSIGLLVGEVIALSEAYQHNQASPLATPQLQYADYAVWQREQFEQGRFNQQLDFWRNQLAGQLAPIELPADRPRPALLSFRGSRLHRQLPPELSTSIKALNRTVGTTSFMVFLAAFGVLLQCYSTQTDLLIGTPITGRSRPELSQVLGCFINMLVLRLDVQRDPTIGELLQRVRTMTLASYDNAELPFEKIIDALRPERDPSRSPLFQIGFLLQDPMDIHNNRPKDVVDVAELERSAAEYDLTLLIDDRADSLEATLVYSTDLFDAATIERMLGHYERILAAILANPEQRVSEIALLNPTEYQLLTQTWSNGPLTQFEPGCIHQLFEQQVAQQSNKVAISWHDGQMTYGELDHRANQLAHHLQEQGIGPEAVVGVFLERSPEALIAILGILKAGAAYLPFDLAYPNERVAWMIADSGMAALITHSQHASRIAGTAVAQICIDQFDASRYATQAPSSSVAPDNAAYLIYTSGSTGVPKGVVVTHEALMHHAPAMAHIYGLKPGERFPLFVSLAFDAAAAVIFPTLITGAALILPPSQTDTALALLDFYEAQHATVMDLPTAYWHQLVDELHAQDRLFPACIRVMLVGGESPSPEKLQAFARVLKAPCTFVNAYGPTEATITATTYQLLLEPGVEPTLPTRIPIGKPYASKNILILDPTLHPTAIGVAGEVYIGGPGLARGYHQRPELTNERFLVDPFAAPSQPQARLYRTGDLARFLPNGQIEFLGRVDHQVKIRGYRVELGEIEQALVAHPLIQQAHVIVREDTPAVRQLVGYVVANGKQADEAALAATLRAFLRERLPEYMVPSAVVVLAHLPLTTNGKIDRQALPAPHVANDQQHALPTTTTEATLATIWAATLGREQVGIHDNFFELGGDSILSLQVVARAHQAGLEMSSRQLFQYQTIAELATMVGHAQVIEAEQGRVAGVVPLTPAQHWLFAQQRPSFNQFNQALLLDVDRSLDQAKLRLLFAAVFEQHDALRLRFSHTGHGWQQAFDNAATSDTPIDSIDLSLLPAAEQQAEYLRVAETLHTSLDISSGPVYRLALFDWGTHRPRQLLLVVHHLVFDSVSWRILLGDLEMAYAQLQHRQPISLPPKTSSFKAWSEQLHLYAQSAALAEQRRFWQAQSGLRVEPVPRDGAGDNHESSARTEIVRCTAEETQQLLNNVLPALHVTLEELLLASYASALQAWSGQSQLLVDLEHHGRAEDVIEAVNLTRSIGWFTAAFPLRLDLQVNSDAALLRTIKEQLREVPDHGIGYGVLRYLAEQPGDYWLQPEISCNYLGQFQNETSGSSAFRLSDGPTGAGRAPNDQRTHVFEINALIAGGELSIHWTYSQNLHHAATARQLAEHALRFIKHYLAPAASTNESLYVPSDFPMAGLDQHKLDALLKKLKRS